MERKRIPTSNQRRLYRGGAGIFCKEFEKFGSYKKMTENEIGPLIVNTAYEVHTRLGPGLLESAYQKCMIFELENEDLDVHSEVHLPLRYKGIKLDCGYRMDLWINKKVVIEIKTVENLLDIHTAQLLTYLKLTPCRLGYLLNFHTSKIKYGIKRIANNLYGVRK